MEPQAQGPVSLPEVVSGVLREHKLAALARMISFDTRLPSAEIVGDIGKIRTIVDNLVSNAVKYSPRGGSIRVELAQRDGLAVLDVVDQGAGVDPQERQRIFESFYQGRPPAEGKVKGSGLGLAIAREYALAHGGRIEAVDRADGRTGAHFRLLLPLSGAPGAQAAAAVTPGRALPQGEAR
jgi:two-component system sensor histidine kinase GlrK